MEFHTCHYIVTGAGGWLGQVTLDVLTTLLGPAYPARLTALGRQEGTVVLASGQQIPVHPLDYLQKATFTAPLVVFHHAFLTKGKVADMPEPVYQAANLRIRQTLTDFLARSNVAGLMVPSSGAVYAYLNKTAAEQDPLFIYGRSKYEDELELTQLADRQGFRAVIPRVFNLSGPYINNHQGYALASIILNCLRHEDVLIRADHPVLRSYCAAADIITMALKIMAEPAMDIPMIFDTVGTEVVEIGDLARRCVQLLTDGTLPIRRAVIKPESRDYYVGNPTVIRTVERQLGLTPAPLDTQIIDTARFLNVNR